MNLFYLSVFLILLGAVLINMSICKYFYQEIPLILWEKTKSFYIAAVIFGISPIIFLLLFLLFDPDILLAPLAFNITCFIGLLIYIDCQICQQKKEKCITHYKFNAFDKIVFALMGIILLGVGYLTMSPRSILLCVYLIIFFSYITFTKIMRKQKIKSFFANKYFRFLEILITHLFYYSCYFIIGIYIITMITNITFLYLDPDDSDGCLDSGVCKAGIVLDGCENKDDCIISKENCLKNNNIWFEDIQSCDIRHTAQ